jgi:branched-chain amino acid transport system ATP-binding protein
VSDVGVSFGAVRALDGVSLEVPEGAFVGLIGPNGAGKTTLFNVVSGFVAPARGRVRLAGRRITDWTPARRARAGLARTFQNVGLDKKATIADNFRIAREGGALSDELLSTFFGAGAENGFGPKAQELVDRLDLHRLMSERVDQLPVGTAKLVELACALMREPRLLLLDEPSSGLGSGERFLLGEFLRELRGTGLTVLLIEHDMPLAMSTVEYLYVLDFGTLLAEGTPDEVRKDRRVIEAYLGKSA